MMPGALAGPGGVHLVDLVLAVLVAEGVILMLAHRRTGRGLAPRACLGLLGAGLFLALALRCQMSGAPLFWVALCLGLAFLTHLDDLRSRLARPPLPARHPER